MAGDGMTKLMDAAMSIDSVADDLVRLIQEGERVDAKASYGFTALHWAAGADECGEVEDRYRRIKILVEAGADVEARDDGGTTPLLRAAAEGGIGQVKALLECGANPNAQDRYGYTSLMFAVTGWRGCEKIPVLLSFGADASIQDAEHSTALDHARFWYLMWKGIAEEQLRPVRDVGELLGQIPPHIHGRLKPATKDSIRIDLTESLARKHDPFYDPSRFRDEAEAILRALDPSFER